jgi:hypothetical protein
VIIVDHDGPEYDGTQTMMVCGKPTIWSGKYRLTSEEWWSKSSFLNTGIALCETEWVAGIDDRCILAPSWLDAVEEAMDKGYAMFGSYEKRRDMVVEGGAIVQQGTLMSMDNRWEYAVKENLPIPYRCTGNWGYGCSWAVPMEWMLQVGGFEEALDGASGEDTNWGILLQNNGFPLFYDMRAHVVQDRTPTASLRSFRREDKGEIGTVRDMSHRALDLFNGARNTSNRHLLLQSRQAVLAGKPFPKLFGSRECWFDCEPVGPDYMK